MWIKQNHDQITLYCVLQSRASKSEIVGLHGTPPRLRIRIAAPPVDGEANEELIRFLSKFLKLSKSQITIHSGHTGKFKEIHITTNIPAEVQQKIEKYVNT
jgi:uncharacterized protein (TIGR00251 family)